MNYWHLICIGAAILAAAPAAAQIQDPGERQVQARLPQGRSPLWATLRQTRIAIDEDRGLFIASHSPAVRALVGKTVALAGFINPLDTARRGNHFLLSKYTPVCDFCPPGEPNEVVEVRTAAPIAYSAKLVTISGTFSLQNNGEKGLFFQLARASVK